MLAPFDDPTNHRLFSVSDEHAVSAWHNILLSYFPERVSVHFPLGKPSRWKPWWPR